ncbi:MAG: DUF2975 domain-containing protein [Leucobacter sp.]
MNRATGAAIKTLIAVLAALMLGFQALVITGLASGTRYDPEMREGIEILLWSAVIAFVLCVQLALACVWRLVTLVDRGRIFDDRAFVWVNGVLGCALAAMSLALVSTVIVFLLQSGIPPFVGLIGIFVTLFCLALALVITVMRALLHQAAHLERELSEVV